jgi:hypothetical protein
MAGTKLTPNQQRRVDQLLEFQKVVDHVRKLVAELDGNRAARAQIIDNICGAIARELSQMRQRALAGNVGTLGDTAGALAVLAARGGSGLAFKIRGLTEGVNSMSMQLDQSMKQVLQDDKTEKAKEKGPS